ncbi:MAG: hypothetical protein F6K19_21025 [Cyanothece sp. SIO1E1]|nr:hypothetical protein [Cyanothece sp. SIO1E1]
MLSGTSQPHRPSTASVQSQSSSASDQALTQFSKTWAKRYVEQVRDHQVLGLLNQDTVSRHAIVQELSQLLRPVSVNAWARTEKLLSEEVIHHQIPRDLVDPWAISRDVYQIYDQAFSSYANERSPERFAININAELGQIRAKYTAVDPRVIGFVSMQFHYTGQIFLDAIPPFHQDTLKLFFKVIDDHLYMPLHRAYEAAAQYAQNAPELQTIHHLIPESSQIAKRIVELVDRAFPGYQCYSGPLSSPAVKVSSIRDVEMFQMYLWVCLLEKNMYAVQQELFPLCVMLYPRLKVSWELVRKMLELLEVEFEVLLTPSEYELCWPYLQSMSQLFAQDVVDQ